MALFTSGSALSALRPGIHDWWGLGYNRYAEEYSQVFEVLKSDMNYERDVNMYGLGMARVRPDGVATEFDSMGEGFLYDYIHVPYSNGFEITHQAIVDNKYMQVAEEYTKELGNSMRETKEIVCFNILNRAFNNSYVYADGKELCSTAHLLSGGGTFANMPAVDVDISELAIEQAMINISSYTDDRGKKRRVMARKLIIHPNDEFEAQRILKSKLRVGTANNDINVIESAMYLPDGFMVGHYLTDPNAWFIKTDCAKGLRFFNREAMVIDSDVEFKTDSILVKAYERYSAGCTDVMGIYGSQGA